MLKNITFSAEPELIIRARKKAEERRSTLNAEFRRWLEGYANSPLNELEFEHLLEKMENIKFERSFSRDELNER
jgi:hypothetical protein